MTPLKPRRFITTLHGPIWNEQSHQLEKKPKSAGTTTQPDLSGLCPWVHIALTRPSFMKLSETNKIPREAIKGAGYIIHCTRNALRGRRSGTHSKSSRRLRRLHNLLNRTLLLAYICTACDGQQPFAILCSHK